MATARLKAIGHSAYKVRRVADLVRGRDLESAEGLLENTATPVAQALLKVVRSAAANAVHNDAQVRDGLTLTSIQVDDGPVLKRYRARSRGRASANNRRTAHVTVTVEEAA